MKKILQGLYKYEGFGIFVAQNNGSKTTRSILCQNISCGENHRLFVMFRYILLAALVATVSGAPAAEPKPAPKPLALISSLKTPASTAKLTAIATPIASPLIAHISPIAYSAPALSHVAPYGYAYSAPLLAAAPASYSIEQHGYNIVY